MANVVDLVKRLSKKHKDRIEKSKNMAANMIKTAKAAQAEAQKK